MKHLSGSVLSYWFITSAVIINDIAYCSKYFNHDGSHIIGCNKCSDDISKPCKVCIHEGHQAQHCINLKLHEQTNNEGDFSAIQMLKDNHKLFKNGKISFAHRSQGPFGAVGFSGERFGAKFNATMGSNNKFRGDNSCLTPISKSDLLNYVPIHRMKDSLYIGTISLGTPPQVVHPIFDTGSTNLWVVGSKCKSDSCTKVKRYDPLLSSTFETIDDSKKIHVKFGTGEIEGSVGIDTIRIGTMAIPNQSIGIVEREGNGLGVGMNVFDTINFEGIVGLAFPEMASIPGMPIFDHLAMIEHLKHKEFSFYIGDEYNDSLIMFGGVDPKYYEGEIKMFPVIREHYWEVELDAIYIGSKRICCDSKSYLIFDSGTSLNTMPSDDFSYFLSHFSKEKCQQNYEKYPTITYVLGGEKITLTPSQYIMKQNDTCIPAYMQLDVPSEFGHAYIVGSNAFMRHYYTVFRRGSGPNNLSMVGIAPSKHGVRIVDILE